MNMKIIILLALLLSTNAFADKELSCVGDDINFAFSAGGASSDVESYWEYIKVTNTTLSSKKYGDFTQLPGRDDVWLRDDNWVQIVTDAGNPPNTGKFTMTLKNGDLLLRQIQAKCTLKGS